MCIRSFYFDRRDPADRVRVLHTMMVAMGVQMFKNGVFNGDPHPGTRCLALCVWLAYGVLITVGSRL